jgi:hypothetical protein
MSEIWLHIVTGRVMSRERKERKARLASGPSASTAMTR